MVPKYMNRVSSNYLDAATMQDGTKTSSDYYKTVSSAEDLNNIFKTISETVGTTTAVSYTHLDSSSALARPPADPQYLHPKQHANVSSHTQLVSRNPLISLP